MRLGLGLVIDAGGVTSVATATPSNVSVPVISGIQTNGQTLTTSNGAWDQPVTSYAYQWKADGTDIVGATSSTLLLATGQVGKVITVSVVATNGFGSSSAATSAATGAIAAVLSISGTPVTSATVNTPYAGFSVSGAGGHTPYVYSVASGTLPSGLSLNSSTGAVSGTPVVIATSSGIVLRVTDADGLTANLASFSIAVSAAPALQRYKAIYDGDIDADNPTFSSGGTISGLNESDDEGALPLGLGLQDWIEWKGLFCGAQDGNVAGVYQLLDEYEDGIPNLQTYMPTGITVLTKAEVTAITYQSTNETTSGNQKTPAVGYRQPGDSQYALVHACSQIIIAMVQEAWCVAGSSDDYELLHWHEWGCPTLRAQVFYEAIDLGDLPDIATRIKIHKASKQNDTRDINARRYLMGHDNGTPADGVIGYGPVAPATPGSAGDLRLIQFGGPAGSSRQEVCCNDDTTGGKAFYLASVVPAGAMGSRIDRLAYASDTKADQAEYYRAADGVTVWNFGREMAANNFSPTAGLITTGGGPLMQTYIGALWPDSNRSASIAVTKSWPSGYGDTSNSLSKTNWQEFVTEVMDRYRTPRPSSPVFTTMERGTLSAGSVPSVAPYLIQAPQGIYNVTLAEGVTVYAWKTRWAQGIWGGSYHLSGGMTYSMQLVQRIGTGPYNAIGSASASWTSATIPTYGDGQTREVLFKVTATNAVGSATTYLSLGTFVAGVLTFTVTGTLPDGVVGAAYSFTPTVSNGPAVSFALTGTLPAGLSFNTSTGAVTGTPTTAGTTTGLNITGTDALGATSNIGAQDIFIDSAVPLSISGTMPDGTVGVSYTFTPTIAGGTSPYSVALTGTLPGGLSLNTTTGVISGTPTTVETKTGLNLTVTDAIGATANLGANQDIDIMSGAAYEAESIAWFAAMTVPPDNTRKGYLNDFIVALKSGTISGTNLLAKMDRLYVGAMHDAQAARVNAISATETLTVVGTPVFLTDAGYESNLAGNLQDSFNPGNGGTYNWLLNDAGLGVGSDLATAAPSGGGRMLSAPTKNSLTPRTNGTNLLQTRNNTSTSVTIANSNGKGLFMLNRLGSTGYARSLNNVEFTAATSASSTPVANEALNWLSDGATGYATNDAHLTIAWAGGGLSVNQRTDIYNAYVAYMTAIGQSARL